MIWYGVVTGVVTCYAGIVFGVLREHARQRARVKAMWLDLAVKTRDKGSPLTPYEMADVVEFWLDTKSNKK